MSIAPIIAAIPMYKTMPYSRDVKDALKWASATFPKLTAFLDDGKNRYAANNAKEITSKCINILLLNSSLVKK